MFYSRSLHNSTKKDFMIFFTEMLRSCSTTHPPCFTLRNITKNTETHSPPMCDVIIEQSWNEISF